MNRSTFSKGIVWGVVGGFLGTIIMDLFIVGFFAVTGMPVDLIYSFIGDVVISFFLRIGIHLSNSTLLGAFMHFFLGLALGGLFGLAVTQIRTLCVDALKKGVLLGALYIELASQPILVAAPLLIKMTSADILQWYSLSTVMHLIYGVVLGGFLSYKQKAVSSMNKAP
jgi:hypothetical protein